MRLPLLFVVVIAASSIVPNAFADDAAKDTTAVEVGSDSETQFKLGPNDTDASCTDKGGTVVTSEDSSDRICVLATDGSESAAPNESDESDSAPDTMSAPPEPAADAPTQDRELPN